MPNVYLEIYEVGLSGIILDEGLENIVSNRATFGIWRNSDFVKKHIECE